MSWGAGIAAFLGGLLARFEGSAETPLKREIVHGVMSFGGGILIAAVAFALVPEGMKILHPAVQSAVFLAGGGIFALVDAYLSKRVGNQAQLLAMLLDFVPEAVSLGAIFTHNRKMGTLLAAYIAAQNLPEGFNSFRDIVNAGTRPRRALATLFAVSFLGPMAAAIGFFALANAEAVTAGIMTFAAGGILYLIFQDIAPQSRMRRSWTPPLGAIVGFAAGMVGKQLMG